MALTTNRPRLWRWFEAGLIALAVLLHLYVAVLPPASLMHWYTNDDAFYYFKVAANITSGGGVTFDGINVTNGFHPLWMLVCIGLFWLARFDLLLPLRLLVIVSGLLSAGTGILIFRTLRRFASPWTAAAAGALWTFLPYVSRQAFQGGLEAPVSAFSLAMLVHLVGERRRQTSFRTWAAVGVWAGLAILARLDNVFVVLLLGIWFVLGTATPYLRTILVGDLASAFIVGLLSYFVGLRAGWCSLEEASHALWLAGAGMAMLPPTFLLFGMYRLQGERPAWSFFGRALASNAAAGAAAVLALFVAARASGRAAFPAPAVLLVDWLGILAATPALRLAAGALFRADGSEPEGLPPVRSWAFWKQIGPRAAGYYLPAAVLLGGYLALNLAYSGAAMPVSGQIKQWWGQLYADLYGSVLNRGLSEMMGSGAWGLAMLPVRSLQAALQARFDQALIPLLVKAAAAAAVLALPILQRRWIARPLDGLALPALFMGLCAQILNYTATPYWHPRDWYWVGEMVFTVLAAGVLLECLRLSLQRLAWLQRYWGLFMSLAGVACVLAFGLMLRQDFRYRQGAGVPAAYPGPIPALEAATEPGSLIGMTGGGLTGYFIQGRTIVNLDGLINSPAYFESVRTGNGARFLDEMGLDYVFATEDWPDVQPYVDIFSGRLAPVTAIDGLYLFRYERHRP